MPDDLRPVAAELHHLSIAEAARLIENRKLSPVELTEALLDRAEALDPQLNAFLLVTADHARAAARAAEAAIMAGDRKGPMHGIPFALKDIFSTAGIRTTGHSRVCIDRIPTEDAVSVAKIHEAGGVLLGKLATHEFAHGGPSFDLPWPPARNPWNTAHITGGSSSGSGAAVAAGLAPAALGSDTGGSIRLPAALCGIVGLKPTYGLVSKRGVYPNSFTFDNAGPMTWTVEDCAILLGAIAGYDAADPGSVNQPVPDYRAALGGDLSGMRLAVVRHWNDDLAVSPEVITAFEAALGVLRELGAVIEDITMRPAKQYSDVKVTIAESELFNVHAGVLRTRPQDFGDDMLGRALGAVLISGADYMEAQRERRTMLGEFDAVWQRYHAIVSPTAPGPAPALGQWRTVNFWQKGSFTTPFNVSGGPSLSQCMGFSASGLPLALQISGRPMDDATILRIGHAYEEATTWRQRRPALVPGATQPPLPTIPEPASDLDAAGRDAVAQACRRAGLSLTERQLEMVCVAAPYVEAMTARLRRPRPFSDEPANIYRTPL